MHINWLGQTCVKLQTKNLRDEDVVILIDAYKPKVGDFPRSFSPQIALFSDGRENAATLSQDPFVVDTLGEFEVKDAVIYALPATDGKIIFKFNIENLSVVHLGRTTKKLAAETIGTIGNVDILLISTGNGDEYLSAEDAAETVTALEPKIVIPLGHRCDTDPKAGPITDFIKNMGLKPEATEKKIIIKKKDLPQEETKLFVLEKNY